MAGILSDMSQGILGVLMKNNPRLAGILGAATDPQFYKDTASNLAHVPVGMTAAAIGAPADIMSMGSNFKPGEMPLSTDWLLKRWYAGRNDGVPETARIASMLPNDASDVAPLMKAMTVFHGSPHKFAPTPNNPLGEFDASKIGTGEGAQAFGHGLYLSERPGVAGEYRRTLSNNRPDAAKTLYYGGSEVGDISKSWKDQDINAFAIRALQDVPAGMSADQKAGAVAAQVRRFFPDAPLDWEDKVSEAARAISANSGEMRKGHLYNVDLPDDQIAKMLDWDAPLSKQPESVRLLAKDLGLPKNATGKDVYSALANHARDMGIIKGKTAQATLPGSQARASEELREFGIPGIKYFDGGSRTAGEGTRNFVVFPGNEGILKILKRE